MSGHIGPARGLPFSGVTTLPLVIIGVATGVAGVVMRAVHRHKSHR